MIKVILALVVVVAPAVAEAAEPQVSPYLYLNRCAAGCTITGSEVDDARANTSSIPCPTAASFGNGCDQPASGTYQIEPFVGSDADWAAVVQCVKEVYSPYAITVTDTLPPGGLSHNQGIVAGRPSNINWSGVGGIAPGSSSCSPRDNVISFTFANIYGGADRINDICATVAQETAHAYGLDHSYAFMDGRSACPDPMSYRSECGGQRFFRNDNATCGEFSPRACDCGGFQNSHLRIAAIFGPGTPITRPPVIAVNSPATGATVNNGATVVATASAQRGVSRLELWLNGYKWATVKGASFGPTGQLETSYPIAFPASVPDGVIDIVIKAYDDINVMAASPVVTVTKGAPCSSASSCAKGQACADGRCFWDPPTGKVGDACGYPQFCETGNCLDTSEGMYCSKDCVVGVMDSCPAGFTCDGMEGGTGFCISEDLNPGCCNVGSDGRVVGMLSLLVLGFVLRRRR